jgi:hypothetical protein
MTVRPMSSRLLCDSADLVAARCGVSWLVASGRGLSRQGGRVPSPCVRPTQGMARGGAPRPGASTTPEEDYRTGQQACSIARTWVCVVPTIRAVLSDAPSGVFDSPYAGVGQITMIGWPSAAGARQRISRNTTTNNPKDICRGRNSSETKMHLIEIPSGFGACLY